MSDKDIIALLYILLMIALFVINYLSVKINRIELNHLKDIQRISKLISDAYTLDKNKKM